MDDQEEEEEFVVVFEFNADLEVAQQLHLLAVNSDRPPRFINLFHFTDYNGGSFDVELEFSSQVRLDVYITDHNGIVRLWNTLDGMHPLQHGWLLYLSKMRDMITLFTLFLVRYGSNLGFEYINPIFMRFLHECELYLELHRTMVADLDVSSPFVGHFMEEYFDDAHSDLNVSLLDHFPNFDFESPDWDDGSYDSDGEDSVCGLGRNLLEAFDDAV